jgi:hypothetical protein
MMFEFRKKALPKLLPSNQGRGTSGRTTFSNGERSWVEHYNLLTLMASVLRERGHLVQTEETSLVHQDTGFILLPQLIHLEPLERSGVRTTTTIQIHQSALVPDGAFEFQHSTGDNLEDSFRKGFDQRAQTDLLALLDALQPDPETCTTLRMSFPEKEGNPAFSRRAVLGPVARFVQNPQVYEEQKAPSGGDVSGEQCKSHEFCPCCLLTKSFEAFKELMEGSGFYGLRLFAARDGKGAPQADCRVNGNDWEKGAEALRRYAATWPEAGYEFRKQYVVLHTVGKESQ